MKREASARGHCCGVCEVQTPTPTPTQIQGNTQEGLWDPKGEVDLPSQRPGNTEGAQEHGTRLKEGVGEMQGRNFTSVEGILRLTAGAGKGHSPIYPPIV